MARSAKIIKWTILIGFNLFCVGSICLWLYQAYSDSKSKLKKLDTEGIETTAQVFRVQTREGSKGEKYTEITYHYEVDGVPYNAITYAHNKQVRTLIEGTPVQIRYVASDPHLSEIIGNEEDLDFGNYVPIALCLGSCWTALFGTWGLVEFSEWKSKRRASRQISEK